MSSARPGDGRFRRPDVLSNPALVALLLALACSGAASLTYQILWLRLLSTVFGVTAYAASTVLAAFMAGLAFGSLLAARGAGRIRRPLRLLAAAEITIAVTAVASALILERLPSLAGSLLASAAAPVAVTLVRLFGTLAVLLVPTTIMGATLPLAVASPLVQTGRHASRLGAIYGTNTAGAIAGALVTGYVLMGAVGMRASFWIAAALNVAAAAIALQLSRREPAHAAPPPVPAADGDARAGSDTGAVPTGQRPWLVLLVLAGSGFASLALEVVWFRILVLFVPATAYAFSTMLATVLGGIAAGGWLAARWLRLERDWARVLASTYAATALLVVASLATLAWTYAAGWRTSGLTQASIVAIFPASLLMGAAFPVAIRLLSMSADAGSDAAGHLGRGYAVNVAGGIAGALVGGFGLLPQFGSRASLIACASLYLLGAALLAWHMRRRPRPIGALAVAIAFGGLVWLTPDPFEATLARRHGPEVRILWREEGVQNTVSVHVEPTGRRVLFLDGLHQANDDRDMLLTHRQIGHLPMALHPDPTRALVIGLGGGATAGAVSRHGGTRVDVVELSDSVRKAAALFAHANDDVLRRPNVRLRVADGRNYLLTTTERYDVVTADIIQPIHAGAGLLYSTEYYALARRVLEEDGLMLQWVGHRPDAQYRLIVRSFQHVFPETSLWAGGTLLVGSRRPLTISRTAFAAKRADPATRAALDAIGLDTFESLLSWYVAGPRALRAFVGDGELLTDDHPRLEYHRSLPAGTDNIDLSALSADRRELAVVD